MDNILIHFHKDGGHCYSRANNSHPSLTCDVEKIGEVLLTAPWLRDADLFFTDIDQELKRRKQAEKERHENSWFNRLLNHFN